MNAEVILNLLQTAVLVFVFLETIRLLARSEHSVQLVFYGFAAASVLLSDLYWLAYDVLRPETRMPFAANEIGEWAMFLLLGAALTARHPIRFQSAKRELVGAILFAAACTALWIAWSGEWVQDILTGVSLGYFLCALVSRIRLEAAFSTRDWLRLGSTCCILIVAQTAIFFVPGSAAKPLDLFCYVLLFAAALAFLVRAVLTLRKEDSPTQGVCHAFAAFAWLITAMYMSSGGFYFAAFVLATLCLPLMLVALKKEAALV